MLSDWTLLGFHTRAQITASSRGRERQGARTALEILRRILVTNGIDL